MSQNFIMKPFFFGRDIQNFQPKVLLDLVAELHEALLVRLQLLGGGEARLAARKEGPLEAHTAGARRGKLRRRVRGHHVVDGVDPSHEVLLVRGLKFIIQKF